MPLRAIGFYVCAVVAISLAAGWVAAIAMAPQQAWQHQSYYFVLPEGSHADVTRLVGEKTSLFLDEQDLVSVRMGYSAVWAVTPNRTLRQSKYWPFMVADAFIHISLMKIDKSDLHEGYNVIEMGSRGPGDDYEASVAYSNLKKWARSVSGNDNLTNQERFLAEFIGDLGGLGLTKDNNSWAGVMFLSYYCILATFAILGYRLIVRKVPGG